MPAGRCIYADVAVPSEEHDELSGEHYLPVSLGRFKGFEELRDRVCGKCNASLGAGIERSFARRGPVALYRKFYGIEGRKHHGPYDPFEERGQDTPSILITAEVPGEGFVARREIAEGKKRLRPMPGLVVKDSSGKTLRCIPLKKTLLDNPDELRTAILEAHRDGNRVEVLCSNALLVKFRDALSRALPAARVTWRTSGSGTDMVRATVIVRRSPAFYRALAKIAFHYFLKQFPRFRGDEPQFRELRAFIRAGAGSEDMAGIQRFVLYGETPPDRVRDMELSKEWSGHILVAGMNESAFYAWGWFFCGFGGPEFSCKVRIGTNPSGLIYEERYAHRFTWFHDGKRNGYHGEMEEIDAPMTLTPPF